MQGLAHQVEEAAASDKFEEANALQAELDSSTEEASALAAEYSFTSADMQDLAVTASLLTEQSLPQQSASNTGSSAKEQAQEGGNKPPVAIAEDHSAGRKTQDSQDLSNALSREGMMEYEDGESVDVDVGYSSSVVSASHAATDGSRSVQSARTVLDRMPEFNMDDAVSFRSLLLYLPPVLCGFCLCCICAGACRKCFQSNCHVVSYTTSLGQCLLMPVAVPEVLQISSVMLSAQAAESISYACLCITRRCLSSLFCSQNS